MNLQLPDLCKRSKTRPLEVVKKKNHTDWCDFVFGKIEEYRRSLVYNEIVHFVHDEIQTSLDEIKAL